MNFYPVRGMHCDSCASLITMELEDAGLDKVRVDRARNGVEIPDEYRDKLDTISEAVSRAGDYILIRT